MGIKCTGINVVSLSKFILRTIGHGDLIQNTEHRSGLELKNAFGFLFIRIKTVVRKVERTHQCN